MTESKTTVYGAIAANVAIAATKFIVAGITGSSAMLSEGIHSTVDTGNGVLLLIGIHLSRRKATAEHPFGHGKELYFWSLIVAVLIFGVGGGASAYEGYIHIRNPAPLHDPTWNYVVLGIAALFESISFAIAMRAFLKEKGKRPFWTALRTSKDPATYTVLAEDAAAIAGLATAAAGVYASHYFNMPVLDGAASVVIGLLLAGVAVLLIRESRGLLIGEGVRPETSADIRKLALNTPGICRAALPLSMYIGPSEALLTLDVEFEPQLQAHEVARIIARLEQQIRSRYPTISKIYIEAGSLAAMGKAAGDIAPLNM